MIAWPSHFNSYYPVENRSPAGSNCLCWLGESGAAGPVEIKAATALSSGKKENFSRPSNKAACFNPLGFLSSWQITILSKAFNCLFKACGNLSWSDFLFTAKWSPCMAVEYWIAAAQQQLFIIDVLYLQQWSSRYHLGFLFRRRLVPEVSSSHILCRDKISAVMWQRINDPQGVWIV